MFATASHSIPNDTPYLRKPAEVCIAIPETCQDELKVGIAWAGNPNFLDDLNRSISLEELLPLFDVPHIAWFNLQVGPRKCELDSLVSAGHWHDLTGDIRDFADTAALVEQLDLVITVDTAVAHLAGAMGKPVWTLLPFVPDWRWQLERHDSPWFPTMRLFRKTRIGESWRDIIEQVKSALCQRMKTTVDEEVPRSVTVRSATSDECWQMAAHCLQQGRMEDAISALLTTARLDPQRKGVHMALGAILKKMDRLEESCEHCRKEVDLDPENPDAHQNLSMVQLALDRFHEAIESGLNAVDLRPDYAAAWLNMGVAWVQINDLDRAVMCFERAIEIDPSNPEPHWHLSTALLARGNFERGWQEHEWRWLMPDFTTPYARYSKPPWMGAIPGARRSCYMPSRGREIRSNLSGMRRFWRDWGRLRSSVVPMSLFR